MVAPGPETVLDGRYRLGEVIGRGGWAVVYRAKQESVGRQVAIKVLEPEACRTEEVLSRTLREAHLVARLKHPNIVTVHDLGTFDGRPCIVMEWVRGPTLGALLRGGNRLEPDEALPIVVQVARALACAHRAGIVHRDIKPANILLETRPDGALLAKVTDFGVATTVASDLTAAGTVIGTPTYMAPEQARGMPVDARADLYALGVVMFRALTGHLPYRAPDAIAMAVRHLTEPIPAFADVAPDARIPRRLEQIVRRLMAKDPADRYPSARALIEDLEAPADQPLSFPEPEGREETLHRPPPRSIPLVAGLAGALMAGFAVSGGVHALRGPDRIDSRRPVVVAPAPPVAAPAPAVPEPEQPPPPATEPEEAEVPGVMVNLAGDARRVWLVDPEKNRIALPAPVVPGIYRVVALFPKSEPAVAGHVRIEGPTTLRCVSFAMRCKVAE